ncbi:MAG: 1-deoxy-D-xylulose-5-phosphate reductoisomerase [Dehalococcoidia bacterium]|nr:MAG: 1-deoxy-D-xylulose-5-phosphate reductoisomerase [Dehalococcoidia bacterium]
MVPVMKRLAILGSTGSIGRQTLEVVRAFPDRLQVVALACGDNVPLIREQIAEFNPSLVFTNVEDVSCLSGGTQHLSLKEIASHPDVDMVIVATAGKAGLGVTLAAIRAGKKVALANKEVLVMAGKLITTEAKTNGVDLYPIDSEHSAIWQCLTGEDKEEISKLILTASGGPFRLKTEEQLDAVTPEEALKHPTWQMGVKVTIDSATLMNKGMELIEARWLFDVPLSRIEVVIHPQSIVHSIVEFIDGSSKAQLSMPDMRLPIQYALTYPDRWESPYRQEIDLGKIGLLQFEPVELNRYPCLRLAMLAGEKGGTYPAVMSAADEVAIEMFLSKRIRFTDISGLVAQTLDQHVAINEPSLEEIIAADAWARETAMASIGVAE